MRTVSALPPRRPDRRCGGIPRTMTHLTVDVRHVGRRAVIAAAGELDGASVPALATTIDRVVQTGAFEIWLDLGSMKFMDSTGLHVVLRLRRRLQDLDRQLAIVCPRGPVRRVFELAGVDHALALHPTLAAAQRQT